MSEREELEARRNTLRSELESLEDQLKEVAHAPAPALSALQAELEELLTKVERMEAEVFDGDQQLTARRDELARIEALVESP